MINQKIVILLPKNVKEIKEINDVNNFAIRFNKDDLIESLLIVSIQKDKHNIGIQYQFTAISDLRECNENEISIIKESLKEYNYMNDISRLVNNKLNRVNNYIDKLNKLKSELERYKKNNNDTDLNITFVRNKNKFERYIRKYESNNKSVNHGLQIVTKNYNVVMQYIDLIK